MESDRTPGPGVTLYRWRVPDPGGAAVAANAKLGGRPMALADAAWRAVAINSAAPAAAPPGAVPACPIVTLAEGWAAAGHVAGESARAAAFEGFETPIYERTARP